MTVQASDYVNYNGKEYTLIDVEKGKDMIAEISPLLPLEKRGLSTACWRGYTAEYYIENNCLYAVRTEDGPYDPNPDFARNKTKSDKERLHYTGSCIIAFDDEDSFHIADFLMCYLDYKEAYELHFTDGILDEVRDLKDAIKEFQTGWADGSVERDRDGIITDIGKQVRDYLTRRDLKYQYDRHTYKWRK